MTTSSQTPPSITEGTLKSRMFDGAPAEASISTALVDESWDAFLQSTPLGQFQQSSIWASVKVTEGWRPIRVTIRQAGAIIAGFQMLVRRRRLLTEGFLNKGPVYSRPDPRLLEWLLDLVENVARSHGIHILIVQSPDSDEAMAALQDLRGYAPNGLAKIITATFCVPLGKHLPPAEERLRRTTRLETRRAVKRGVIVREGGAADVPAFFRMMCTTCRRQKTSPNPSTEAAVLALWSAFAAKGLARLTFADCEGEPTAGLLTICFGNRVTQWKTGWTEQHREKHPNTLLAFEGIEWAENRGSALVDFVGGDRTYARSILAGSGPDKTLLSSRYFFLLGFGAEAQLLPLARVWIPCFIYRMLYRCIVPALRMIGRVEE